METELLILSESTFKHSEIKLLLTEKMKRFHPSFRFLTAATGVYHFQRIKDFRDYDLREAIHFVFSQVDYSMHVSISSRLNNVHTLTPAYNDGLINPHVDLGALVKHQNVYPSDDTAYHSDGSIDSLTTIINQAIDHFGTEGLSYLESRSDDLQTNALVNIGIDITEMWRHDRTMLRNELSVQLRRAKLMVNKLRHPVCNELKEQLEAIPDLSTQDRQQIPRLAFELMELYCNSRIIS